MKQNIVKAVIAPVIAAFAACLAYAWDDDSWDDESWEDEPSLNDSGFDLRASPYLGEPCWYFDSATDCMLECVLIGDDGHADTAVRIVKAYNVPAGSLVIPSIIDGKIVTSIADCAFSGCSGITSVTIPASVTSIGGGAFYGCSGLTSVVIPDGVKSIGGGAFADCINLKNVVIPNSVKSIGEGAFSGCSESLYDTTTIPNVTMVGGWVVSCSDTISGALNLSGALGIAVAAFYECSGLTRVVIPSSVKSIGAYAFAECKGLVNVTIPNTVTSIGCFAFSGCSEQLYSTTIPNVTIVDGWVVGCAESISGALNLAGVRGVGDYVFSDCKNLASVVIPDSVKSVGEGAFYRCDGLTSVVVGNGVNSIGDCAFRYCSSLANLAIGSGVKSIGRGAFEECGGLKSVTIPDGVTYIGGGAFTDCGLTNMAIGRGVTSIEASTFHCCNLTSAIIPDNVTSIGYRAFSCCSLRDVTIGKGVTNIGAYAFFDCGLTSVTIPANVVSIGVSAFCRRFGGCSELLYETVPHHEVIAGASVGIDLSLIGYTAKGLPSGLRYDMKTGKVTGSVKVPGEYEVTFTKNGEADETMIFTVRAEELSVGCVGLSLGAFTSGVAGNAGGIPLEINTETGVKSVSVSKLPTGMKYDTKTGLITGGPSKAGDYEVTLTVTTKSGAKRVVTVPVVVAATADGAVGTFNGFVKAPDREENLGTFMLTATEAGKLTAKITTASGTCSFSGVCWDSVSNGVYQVALSTKKGEALLIVLDSAAGWDAAQLSGVFTAAGSAPHQVVARKNAFGKMWYFSAEGNETSGWTLAYAKDAKAAALTVTFNADGSTKIVGKLGTLSVNASGYADVTGLVNGVIFADFTSVLSVKEGKATVKKALSIRTNLWFDRLNTHAEGVGSAMLVE